MPEHSGRQAAPPPPGEGLLAFIRSRVFWVNALAALAAVLILSLIALQLLRAYTGHNRYITVPDCQGLTLDQAVETLERRDLRVQVMDSLYDPALLPLSVMGQYPAEGAEVKEGRVIHLTVNKTRPQMVDVPVADVLEKTLRSVQFNLQSKGFKIGELIYRPGVYDNQVVELRKGGSPKALARGAKLPKGSTIDLVVTDGYGNSRIELPDFTGMSLGDAQFLIVANNLVEGSFVFDPGVDSAQARVYRQEPEAGEDIFVREGSMINLWLGDAPVDPNQPNNPNLPE